MSRRGPRPSSLAAAAVMRGNRGRDTKPELRLRSAVHRLGLRFRKHQAITVNGVRVRPDLVFKRARIAVFLDGCLWHSCPHHGMIPKANRPYWAQKFRRNVERDFRVNDALAAEGWRVVRVWEHEDPNEAAQLIRRALRAASTPNLLR